MAKKRSSFRGKVAGNATKSKSSNSSYGYLLLPEGIRIFNPPLKGSVKLDFLPYEVTDPKHLDRDDDVGVAMVGDLWYKKPFFVHRNIGANNDVVVCPTTIGKKCPICEAKAKMRKDQADYEDIKLLNTSKRNLYVVIPLDVKEEEEPHIFDISQHLFQNQLTEELEENDENEVFPDLEDGKALKLRFVAKTIKKGKPFPEVDRIDFLERDEVYDSSILEDIPNLDEVLQILSYQQLKDKFQETESDEDAGDLEEVAEEEDEKPHKHSHSKANVKRKKDEEDEEDEDEEEEEEKPRRKSLHKKPVGKSRKDDDEDDEDENEDDEPKKPSRTIRKNDPSKKHKCPNGHKFGRDFDSFDDCADCPLFDACGEENEKG